MNRTNMVFSVGAVAILVGCTTSPRAWEKGGAPRSQADADKAQCEYEAKAATASYATAPSKKGEPAALGNAIGDGIAIAEKQVELTNECMKAKGYVAR